MFFQFFHVLLSNNRKIKVQKEGALSKSRLTLSWAGTTDFIIELRVSKSKRNSKVPFPLWILYVFYNWYGRANIVVYLYEQNSSQWSSNAGECYLWKTLYSYLFRMKILSGLRWNFKYINLSYGLSDICQKLGSFVWLLVIVTQVLHKK